MKIALAQINCTIGDFKRNTQKIIQCIEEAKSKKYDLIAFPELSVCGYPPGDLLEFDFFIDQCLHAVERIAKHCHGIAAIIGSPEYNQEKAGKRLFNSAFFLCKGKIQSVHRKALLPTYDVFDEYRYFEPASECSIILYQGKRIALTICEDIWNTEDQPTYSVRPMGLLARQHPDLLINIAASPFDHTHDKKRLEILKHNAVRFDLPICYVNHVGAQTNLIFDGGSLYMNKHGQVSNRQAFFKEGILYSETHQKDKAAIHTDPIHLIYHALVLGIADYFSKLNMKKAVLGLSGGIDSAVTLCLAAKALGKERVLSVMMPSAFSSKHSVSDSLDLIKNIGCPFKSIEIDRIYDAFTSKLKTHFDALPFDITEENIQARIRAVILMALANKHGYILLNTSNKSETAVGYGTLYGDMAGGLSVIGDVYKTQVYQLAKYINRNREIIPENIILKPPSAELRPDQLDRDTLPDYEILDKVLFQYIEMRKNPKEISVADKNIVLKIIGMVNRNEYKRQQTPPILRVSPKSFGMGRRMPVVATYFT